jgi:hypothetical protein
MSLETEHLTIDGYVRFRNPLVAVIPSALIEPGKVKCELDILYEESDYPYDLARDFFTPVKVKQEDKKFRIIKGICCYQAWKKISPNHVPVIHELSLLYDRKFEEKNRDMHILTEAHIIKVLRDIGYLDMQISHMLRRSPEKVRAIAMLAALPNSVQAELLVNLSSVEIENSVIKPVMAHIEGLMDKYDPQPGLRVEEF